MYFSRTNAYKYTVKYAVAVQNDQQSYGNWTVSGVDKGSDARFLGVKPIKKSNKNPH